MSAMDDAAVLEAMARIKKFRNRRPGDVNPTRIQVRAFREGLVLQWRTYADS